MGMSNLKDIVKNLISNGKSEDTPAAVINWATLERQKVAVGKLSNIYEVAAKEGLTSPSLIVVGEVVGLRDKLNFFEKKPLMGKNIVVTRARAQSSSLVDILEELGAQAIEVPVIKINRIIPNEELDDAIYNIKDYNYIIFTSINGVNIFFQRVFELGFDARILGGIKIVAIGKATSSELNKYSIFADIIPEKFISEGIVEELKGKLVSEDNVLIPRAKEARSYLVEELRKLCFVNEVKTYQTLIEDSEKEQLAQLLKDKSIDYITFTSSSTVSNFLSQVDECNKKLLDNVKLISIGPITSETMRKHGLKVYKEAFEYNIDGIVNCILNESDVK